MSRLSLAAKYRPQTFAQVIGQDLATTALSRAAAKSSPAPAYLLSGTRGVGKTTIARIFAKALNCANGPSGEPCNGCDQCLHITNGNHVDVCEIDAASNTGVDDVRALKEKIGYLPMEGRYKIFIVDEAHMLSKSAFNALLKTLEEPPAHSVFIFATTEVHRFPATIISRCQHFVFRYIPETLILEHLKNILQKEGVSFDEGAPALIAKRAAGSARDSLSLLDQTLALTQGHLSAEIARKALGLAGQEFFMTLFAALAQADNAHVLRLCRELLSTGIDIGFFAKELSSWFRSLFLFRESGDSILSALSLTNDEIQFVKEIAPNFTTPHLHAAWQMSLESQRSITQSPDPGVVLELLLLNIAMLPRLLPVGSADKFTQSAPEPQVTESAQTKETHWELKEKNEAYKSSPSTSEETQETAPVLNLEGFLAYCYKLPAEDTPPHDCLRGLKGIWQDNRLTLYPATQSVWDRLQKNRRLLNDALELYCQGNAPELVIIQPNPVKSEQELIQEYDNSPEIKLCKEILGARISHCEDQN